MDCLETRKLITPYLEDTIPREKLQGFISHVKNCPECYDELETFFAIRHTLDALDRGLDADYHLRESLQNDLDEKEKALRTDARWRRAGRVLLIFIIVAVLILIALIAFPNMIAKGILFIESLFAVPGGGA